MEPYFERHFATITHQGRDFVVIVVMSEGQGIEEQRTRGHVGRRISDRASGA